MKGILSNFGKEKENDRGIGKGGHSKRNRTGMERRRGMRRGGEQ